MNHVIIIGAGPVGLFTVFQAGLLGMKSILIDALPEIGGQCSALYPEKPIYDIPGFYEIEAAELVEKLRHQMERFKPQIHLNSKVIAYEKDENEVFHVTCDTGETFSGKAIVIAAGAGAFGPNRPPLKNIENYEGHSVFYMVKKKNDFANKKIMIAGGGDSAVDWALSLSDIAQKTYLMHRRDQFRAHPDSIKALHKKIAAGAIELLVPYQLFGLHGEGEKLTSVEIKDMDKNTKCIDVDALLPFYGLASSLKDLADWGLTITKRSLIEVHHGSMETAVSGIYAIGDVAKYEGKYKLILQGFSESAVACHHAFTRVVGEALHFEHSTTRGIGNE